MTSPRLRRLAADWQAIRAEFSGHPHVQVTPQGPGRPPEQYQVDLRIQGLRLDGTQPVYADFHRVEIQLPRGYPRDQPQCTPLTPIFHPNIKGHFCIQDYWAAGQPLVDTIAKLADMIQYRVYNPGSPLDAVAAQWAREHPELFPIGNVSLETAEIEIVLGSRVKAPPTPVDPPGISAEESEIDHPPPGAAAPTADIPTLADADMAVQLTDGEPTDNC